MARRRGLLAFGGPGCAVLGAIVVALVAGYSWLSFAPVFIAVLTTPLWPRAQLAAAESDEERHELVLALNVQLTFLVALAIGAFLVLFFIGLPILVFVVVFHIVFSLNSARRIWIGERVDAPKRMIHFVK